MLRTVRKGKEISTPHWQHSGLGGGVIFEWPRVKLHSWKCCLVGMSRWSSRTLISSILPLCGWYSFCPV
ncbi:hypothetical protein I7I50_09916 [Histoplasma capsulatum G186AR]|uniref:Uncharacterized protein n=1 Tax=Ajellomyces capsulatus TaxID=5037 RepID=A0A8H7Z8Q2_AJECA|nr:hypothetical protein I7I52_01154 [Histoplasma capsulatum]QSS68821.1 hypothetical protein I7I50_09916 [Histoplasma capsulatum G186AR]